MAEEQQQERNYDPSARRLEKAREEGQVARSRELSTAGVALAAACGFALLAPALYRRCALLVEQGLSLDRDAAFNPDRMMGNLSLLAGDSLIALLPLFAVLLVAALGAPMLLSGWLFSVKAFTPDFSRLDPISGLGRIVSWNGIAELVKAVAKCVLLGGIGVWLVAHDWMDFQALVAAEPASAIARVGELLAGGFFALAGGLAVIALVDAPYSWWRHRQQLRMTREDLRQEMREGEGDPQLKARIRALQRAAARKRMMSAVPGATVIVTNPTHYAVALEYRDGEARAPRVVAKGTGHLAQRIREIGAQNDVPLLEAPPLARALYRHAEVGAEIPQTLYAVVAQLLAYIYQVRRWRAAGGSPPVAPTEFEIPDGLDPGPGAAAAAGAAA